MISNCVGFPTQPSLCRRGRGRWVRRFSAGLVPELVDEELEEVASPARVGCGHVSVCLLPPVYFVSRTCCLSLAQRVARIAAMADVLNGAMDSTDTAVEARASEDLVRTGGQDWSAGRGCGAAGRGRRRRRHTWATIRSWAAMKVRKGHLMTSDGSLLTSTLRNTAHSRRPIGTMAGYFAVASIVDCRLSIVGCLAGTLFVMVETHSIESVFGCLQSASSGER